MDPPEKNTWDDPKMVCSGGVKTRENKWFSRENPGPVVTGMGMFCIWICSPMLCSPRAEQRHSSWMLQVLTHSHRQGPSGIPWCSSLGLPNVSAKLVLVQFQLDFSVPQPWMSTQFYGEVFVIYIVFSSMFPKYIRVCVCIYTHIYIYNII